MMMSTADSDVVRATGGNPISSALMKRAALSLKSHGAHWGFHALRNGSAMAPYANPMPSAAPVLRPAIATENAIAAPTTATVAPRSTDPTTSTNQDPPMPAVDPRRAAARVSASPSSA